jgi:hypothetical protein
MQAKGILRISTKMASRRRTAHANSEARVPYPATYTFLK